MRRRGIAAGACVLLLATIILAESITINPNPPVMPTPTGSDIDLSGNIDAQAIASVHIEYYDGKAWQKYQKLPVWQPAVPVKPGQWTWKIKLPVGQPVGPAVPIAKVKAVLTPPAKPPVASKDLIVELNQEAIKE